MAEDDYVDGADSGFLMHDTVPAPLKASGKPAPNPEWEAKAKAYHDEITAEVGINPFDTLTMLERWKSDAEPANEQGQVSFSRAMLDSATDALRNALEIARNEHLRAEALERRLKRRPHPTPEERQSRAMTFDHVTRDDFEITLREAHADLDDAQNDLAEAKGALEASDLENDRLRAKIAQDASIVASASNCIALRGALTECAEHFEQIAEKARHWGKVFARNDDAVSRWMQISRWADTRASVARAALSPKPDGEEAK